LGVCGRAPELGSFVFGDEMPLASELLALKYLKIVTEIFTKQPVAKKNQVPAVVLN